MRTIKGINFKSIVAAGLIAGYAMYFVDHWFNGLFGLFGWFPGTDNWGWMLTHHLDSILIALPFAWQPIYSRLPGAGWLKGLIYGFLWWLIVLLVLGMIFSSLGAQPLAQLAPSSAAGIFTAIILHVVWGFVVGVIYNPETS